MQTSEVLNKAADLIEKHGWRQGSWGIDYVTGEAEEGSPLCIEGAIIAALPAHLRAYEAPDRLIDLTCADECAAGQAVHRYLRERGDGVLELNMFNDDQADAIQVIEVLRAAAVIEASRERQTAEVSA